MLLVSALAALTIANSPWSDAFEQLWRLPLTIGIADHSVSLSIRSWINDGLMAVFFLLVGLEIKRECMVGELSSPRLAALPIAGAVGGMVLPAAIYLAVAAGTPAAGGWAIPMATDIAFALGTMAIVAPHAPPSAKLFLSALAIVDDLGAVLVIAFFYSAKLSIVAVGWAVIVIVVLVVLNRIGVRRLSVYLLLGVVLWWFVHESGLHATIAGVLLAMTIPTRSRINAQQFSRQARSLLDEFDRSETGDFVALTSKGQQEALFALECASEAVTEPLLRLEYGLHSLSAFVIMPLFALANAGVAVSALPDASVATATILGLVVGKSLGVTLAAWVVVGMGAAVLPTGLTWPLLHACAWLGGIGFTMSIFIATLAFEGTALLDGAKASVIVASVIAGIGATILLRRAQ